MMSRYCLMGQKVSGLLLVLVKAMLFRSAATSTGTDVQKMDQMVGNDVAAVAPAGKHENYARNVGGCWKTAKGERRTVAEGDGH